MLIFQHGPTPGSTIFVLRGKFLCSASRVTATRSLRAIVRAADPGISIVRGTVTLGSIAPAGIAAVRKSFLDLMAPATG